ncbi:hypothetical protein L1765_07420 [Microaerobacter geothermalis]|uniref:hypothetical protein n=1 Tax=Microaerobacter geothermalis TaxID=674972 RepID=UPI001F3C3E2B|nr:hypothetical protein [Microaerobacter geothermalis]MCF6093809.1 hypothetical protein [Microaerobacter geothermalis]
MSFKSVELQVALPRTQELGKIQEQINQRTAQDQAALASQQIKQLEYERKRSGNISRTEKQTIRRDQKNKDDSTNKKGKKSTQKKKDEQEAVDPYKGRYIDISL